MQQLGEDRALALTLAMVSIGVVAATVLGPLAAGRIEYHVVDDLLNQIRGGDAVGLALVAPTAAVAAVLTWRRHRAGPVVALAPCGYALYTYAQLAVGGEFASEPGNSERFFPLFLAIFVAAGLAFVKSWARIDPAQLPRPTARVRRLVVAVLGGLSVFLVLGLHLPGLVDVLGGEPYDVDYTQSPTVFWLVKLMDLGVVVPVMVATAVGVRRQASWATRAMYVVVGWGALLGSAVGAMGIVMVANDDPAGSVPVTIGFVIGALALLALAARLVRPLFGSTSTVDSVRLSLSR